MFSDDIRKIRGREIIHKEASNADFVVLSSIMH
jgi:hypothetical protein